MIFFHGTKEDRWKKIQEEGVLWGRHYHDGRDINYRYTYLSPDINVALEYGSVTLAVEYEPVGNKEIRGIDNYGFKPPPGMACWQFSVFVPIPLGKVRRLSPKEIETYKGIPPELPNLV